jgi:SAM-dependent methyltransferase
MKYSVTERTNCRVCGSKRLVCFLELPDVPLTDQFLLKHELGTEFLWPVRVYFCEDCGLTQTLHDVSVEDYYRDYRYSVAFSSFAQYFMYRLAEEVWQQYQLQPGDTVLEVGSSDGAQLACFQALGAKVFGFEPSAPLVQIARSRGIPVAQCLFTPQTAHEIPADFLPVRVLLLTYTFDHLPDPMGFLAAVQKVLDPERGVLILEVHDLEKIIKRREFCLFAHEHTAYYTAATMQMALRRAGFELVSINLVPENERRGNSLLVAATLQGSTLASRALPTLSLGPLGITDTYLAFGCAVQDSLLRFRKLIQDKRQKGMRLAGYGAGGRDVMTLAVIARPGDFAYVCDKNPAFHGRYTPGAHVLVNSPERLLTDPVDELIVFSFGYFREICDELVEFRARGGKLISMLDLL